jgi:hypothetical protein
MHEKPLDPHNVYIGTFKKSILLLFYRDIFLGIFLRAIIGKANKYLLS